MYIIIIEFITQPNNIIVMSRKFWSGENFGPGDQNSRKIGPAGPLFPENVGPAVE